jgi:hypothetical protein
VESKKIYWDKMDAFAMNHANGDKYGPEVHIAKIY